MLLGDICPTAKVTGDPDGNPDPIAQLFTGASIDNDHDGFSVCIGAGDPDDDDATVYPNAPELCDNKDNNGDGQIDEGNICCPIGNTGILYVNAAASGGTANGLSWPTAFTSLQSALSAAKYCTAITQIWVAKGTYYPSEDEFGQASPVNNRTKTFMMRNGLAIYGGFDGTEGVAYDLTQRNFGTNQTILSGDIGTPVSTIDNVYHVVLNFPPYGSSLTNTASLDGFTISGGTATGSLFPHNSGGGLLNFESSPGIKNCLFTSNSAQTVNTSTVFPGNGGGVANFYLSSPTLTSSTLSGGIAYFGGGLYSEGSSNPVVTGSTFSENIAYLGGGLYCQDSSNPVVTGSTFLNNTGASGGGGVASYDGSITLTNSNFTNNMAHNGTTLGSGGGIRFAGLSAVITNCLFYENKALGTSGDGGGAIIIYSGTVTLLNSTLANNQTPKRGGAVRIIANNPAITSSLIAQNSIFWNNTASLDGSTISNASGASATVGYSLMNDAACPPNVICDPTGIIYNSDPLFVNLAGGNLSLNTCSPAINAGDPATTSATVGATDLLNQLRFYSGSNVDMGAMEYQGVGIPTSFSVLGSGTATCTQSPTITLSGSQTGVTYQLLLNGANSGSAVAGTGAVLSFGTQPTSGTYTVVATPTVTIGAACTLEMASSATVVSNTALPTASLVTSGSLNCTQTSVTLTASGGVSYTFASAGGTLGTPGSASTLVVSTGSTYSVTVGNANGCTSSTTTTVLSDTAIPTASLSAISLSFCAGTTLTLTASGGSSYTFGNGATQTGGSSSNTATVTQSGVYTVVVSVATGCTNTATISVTAIPLTSLVNGPVATSVVCAGAAVSVGVSATGAVVSYQWYKSSLASPVAGQTAATLSIPNAQTGPPDRTDTGSYSVVVTGVCNSVTSTAFSLTVNTIPTVNITANPSLTILSGQSGTLTASGAASYNWSNLAIGTPTGTTAITVSVAGLYSVTGTTNGCSSTASVVMSVSSAAPVITAQPASASSVCEGASVMVPVSVTGIVTSYQWLKGGSPVAGQTTATLSLGNVQVSNAGVYSLSLTGPTGSTTSSGFTLSVNSTPTATITFPNSVTVAGSPVPVVRVPALSPPVVFQASGGGVYDRLIIVDRLNGYEIRQNDSNNTGIFPINRLGLFTLMVTGANGCSRTVQWVVQ